MFAREAFLKSRPGLRHGFRRFQSTASSQAGGSWRPYGSAALLAGSFATGWAVSGYGKPDGEKKPSAMASLVPSTVPLIDTKSGQPFEFSSPLTPDQVTEYLNRTAWSYTSPSKSGVSRYDGAQAAANNPSEDNFTHGHFPSPYSPSSSPNWLAWGVFDGHLGAQTSVALSKHLLPYVAQYLSTQPADEATGAIKEAFLALDSIFISTAAATASNPLLSFPEKITRLTEGTNGSCAILALLDPSTRTLRVVCTGDSRAVLGQPSASSSGAQGEYDTIPLSIDQSGSSATEIARVQALHPGEDGVIKDGRILGLMCTRAFGDGRWKWPAELIADLKKRFRADRYKAYDQKFKTAPYVTAEPEVTTTVLPPAAGRGKEDHRRTFMIIASDGLWDTMSNEQAVALVGRWVEWQAQGRPKGAAAREFGAFDFGGKGDDEMRFEEEKMTVQDENAAVHLIRNALGGAHHEKVSGVLAFKPPFAREVRDDITVQVVFFE